MASLGEKIRARRKELGLTQSQLGGTELTKGFISLVEKGRAKPSLETLLLLAQRLQAPVGYFLEESPPAGRHDLRVALQAGWTHLKRGAYSEAEATFSEAVARAQENRDDLSEAEGHAGLACALAELRRLDLAREHAARARALEEATGSRRHTVWIRYALGLIEYAQRNLGAARDHFLHASRDIAAEGTAETALAGRLLITLGDACQEAGDDAEAVRWYREALALLEPTEDLHRVGMAHAQLGDAQRESGNADAALAHLTRAEHIFELLDDLRLLARARTSIAVMLLERGEADEAIAHLHGSLRLTERLRDDPGRARALRELARALVLKRAFARADGLLAEAEQLAAAHKDAAEVARIQLVRARSHRGQGHAAEAVQCYRRAIAAFEDLQMRRELAASCNELGEFLLEQKRPSEAAPYLARALQALRGRDPSGAPEAR
jgi:tetratricopeptide (TPR) repeat protein